jgi:hypothetical protein
MTRKAIIGLLTLTLTLTIGCTRYVATPSAAPAPEEEQAPAIAPAEQQAPTSLQQSRLTVIRSEDFELGPYVYREFPFQLNAGDQFSGSVLARRNHTVLIEIEDPRGMNHGPSQCMKYWEWDITVRPGQQGEWMLYIENTKWLGIVDVDLEWEITQ